MLSVKRDWGRVAKAPNAQGQYRCSLCREWKEVAAFNKNKQQTSGLSYACKSCMRVQTQKYNLPAKYGISSSNFAAKLLAQGGKCACCEVTFTFDGAHKTRPCVDHNHVTSEVRDLLCGKCNLAAGNVSDSSTKAEQLAAYLKKWKC